MVALSFEGTFHLWKKRLSKICYIFLPFFDLHCFSQVDYFFTFNLDYSVNLLFLYSLCSIETKNLRLKIPVLKQQSLILLVTRRYVQSEHSVVLSVPVSPQIPKVT